jgi:hypothetical protein
MSLTGGANNKASSHLEPPLYVSTCLDVRVCQCLPAEPLQIPSLTLRFPSESQ